MTRAENQPRKRIVPNPDAYWWFKGDSVRELFNRLAAVGPDTARLEVRVVGDKMTFRVLSAAANAADPNPPDINNSFLCPPICG